MDDSGPDTPRRGAFRFLGVVAFAAACFVATQNFMALSAGGAAGSTAPALYGADSVTLLYDDFENSNRASAQSPNIAYQSGYLGGQALFIPDTTSWIAYNDSWWQKNENSQQESGTIEFYYRPETYIFTTARPHEMLFTIGERRTSPLIGQPNLSVQEKGKLVWAIARSSFGTTYDEISSDQPPLNPGQWYHIAATWSDHVMKLFRNGTEVAGGPEDAFALADTFLIGATGALPLTRGLAARGRFDRLRLSSRARTESELPSAMDVRIDSPVDGGDVTAPFFVAYRAFESATRVRQVDLYVDTDEADFNGTPVSLNLPESGTVLTGAGLPANTYFLYAVAHAGGDSAYFYVDLPVTVTPSSSYAAIVDPTETTAAVAASPTASDSFLLVLLNGGGTTTPPLVNATNAAGSTANYAITTRLLAASDSVRIILWTSETAPSILVGVRTDVASLDSNGLPAGIPNTAAGRNAFGATVFSLEFLRSNSIMIGDTASTRSVADTFAYTLEYTLSAATASRFKDLGFNIDTGSESFGFYYADTYAGTWTLDRSVKVSVVGGSAGGIVVRVVGVTRDLPGGLGAGLTSVATVQTTGPNACLIERAVPASWLLELLRAMRDLMLSFSFGRWIASLYYAL